MNATNNVNTAFANLWMKYAADFNALTDSQIEQESEQSRSQIEEGESWLEAVASWEAAGKPRAQVPA